MRKQRRRSASRTAKLISAFVFATRILQSLCFLNPKFQASSNLLWLYRPVCVGPGRKPRRPVFSQRGLKFQCYMNEHLSCPFLSLQVIYVFLFICFLVCFFLSLAQIPIGMTCHILYTDPGVCIINFSN